MHLLRYLQRGSERSILKVATLFQLTAEQLCHIGHFVLDEFRRFCERVSGNNARNAGACVGLQISVDIVRCKGVNFRILACS